MKQFLAATEHQGQGGGGASGGEPGGVQLVCIGSGSVGLGRSLYKRVVGAEKHPSISMYTDPKRQAFAAMGARYGLPSFECGRCLSGTCVALWQGLTRCWCMCGAGDVKQQGAAFVLAPGQQGQHQAECRFRHIEQRPGDHADAKEFFRAAGLHLTPEQQRMK